uniref:Ketoreductase (KR) domain-containing protein n=1 Tax=Zooxanthella nutricula TaxID=1333877 RepID=A0A7S2VIV6_9DINO
MASMQRLARRGQGVLLARGQLGGFAKGLHFSDAPGGANTLNGDVAWVVGGAGPIGRGIARGLLKAGATVIVSSNSETRLKQLRRDLDNPSELLTIQGTMRPAGAADLVKRAMDMTNSKLNHVVAHSGVRWWGATPAKEGGDCEDAGSAVKDCEDALANSKGRDCEDPLASKGSGLEQDPAQFAEHASLLPVLHFTAAKLLLPHLQGTPGSSYTFVTGGAGADNVIDAQVNAYGVRGLATALRSQHLDSTVRVSEVRVNLKINRPARERATNPRSRPLTADLGEMCAGLAACRFSESGILHKVDTMEDVGRLWARYPCPAVVDGLPVLWHWEQA